MDTCRDAGGRAIHDRNEAGGTPPWKESVKLSMEQKPRAASGIKAESNAGSGYRGNRAEEAKAEGTENRSVNRKSRVTSLLILRALCVLPGYKHDMTETIYFTLA